MTDKISIHTGRLGNDAGRIYDCIMRIRKETDAMQSSAAALESMWEGEGSQSFHKSFRDDIQAMEAVICRLQEMYEYDSNAKKAYESCEKKIAAMIAELKVQ